MRHAGKTCDVGPAQGRSRRLRTSDSAVIVCMRRTCVMRQDAMTKTTPGNFFEDFRLGQIIRTRRRAPSRPATSRSTTRCSARASRCNPPTRSPMRSAIRARRSTTCWCSTSCSARPCRTSRSMRSPISATPTAASCARSIRATRSPRSREVIGLKENSSRKTGVVYVRSTGFKQDGAKVLEYVRWVMVRKRDEAAAAPGDLVPRPAEGGRARRRSATPARRSSRAHYDFALAGCRIASATTRSARRSTMSTA